MARADDKDSERPRRNKIALFVLCLLGIPLLMAGCIAYTPVPLPMPYQIHQSLFCLRMNWEADVPAIRKWMAEQPVPPQVFSNTEMPKQQWPPEVRKLSPQFVGWAPDGNTLIVSMGGSGFGHWGLVIARPGCEMYPADRVEYRKDLTEGACVFEHE